MSTAYATNSYTGSDNVIPTDLLQKSEKFRTELGFDSSAETIKNIYLSQKKLRYGVVMADQELQELNKRKELIDRGKKIRDELLTKQYADNFGGMYFDHLLNNGTLRIGIVDLPNHMEQTVQIGNYFDSVDHVDFFNVAYPIALLQSVQEQLYELSSKQVHRISYSEISIPHNKIQVYLTPENADLMNVIKGKFNPDYFVFNIDAKNIVENTSRTSAYNPLWGGIKIVNTTIGGGICTGAFSAKDSGGGYYYLTAGHCGAVGDTFTQGGNTIGTVDSTYGTGGFGVDVLMIGISSSEASSSVYDENANFNNELAVSGWESIGGGVVGETVCFSGVTTNQVVCGTLVGIGAYGQRTSSITTVAGGDSGSPVYNPDYMTSGAYAEGIVKGFLYVDHKMIYSEIGKALDVLGLSELIWE